MRKKYEEKFGGIEDMLYLCTRKNEITTCTLSSVGRATDS